jgi:tetratricopeptide (TPR) repeat protein
MSRTSHLPLATVLSFLATVCLSETATSQVPKPSPPGIRVQQQLADASLPNPSSLSLKEAITIADKLSNDNRAKECIPYYSRAIAVTPTANEKLFLNRARAYEQIGQFANALSDVDRSLSIHYSLDAITEKALVLDKAGRFNESLAVFDSILAQNPHDVSVIKKKSETLVEAGNCDAAIALLTSAMSFAPNEVKLYAARCRAYTNESASTEAMADANKEIQLGGATAEALVDRAYVEFHLREYDRALADCTAALNIEPRNTYALGCRAYIEMERHENTALHRDAELLLSIEPDSATGLSLLGNYYSSMKKYDVAGSYFARSLEITPSQAMAYMEAAENFQKLKQHDKAMELLADGIKHVPDNPGLFFARALFENEAGDYGNAIEDANRSIQLGPKFAAPYIERAKAHLGLHQAQQALSDIDELQRLNIGGGHESDISEIKAKALAELKQLDRTESEISRLPSSQAPSTAPGSATSALAASRPSSAPSSPAAAQPGSSPSSPGLSHRGFSISSHAASRPDAPDSATSSPIPPYGKLGFSFTLDEHHLPTVRKVVDGTPAAAAHIKIDDRIVAADGISTAGLTKEQVSELLRSRPSATIILTINRNGAVIKVSCVRDSSSR